MSNPNTRWSVTSIHARGEWEFYPLTNPNQVSIRCRETRVSVEAWSDGRRALSVNEDQEARADVFMTREQALKLCESILGYDPEKLQIAVDTAYVWLRDRGFHPQALYLKPLVREESLAVPGELEEGESEIERRRRLA